MAKKITSILLSIFLVISLFSGCSTTEEEIDLIYPFSGDINSYDPQVASTTDEFLIIENCFEGLVRCDDEGNITAGCASSWDVSDDGLTYTFYLQKGLKWYIFNSVKERMGEDYDPEITANDFVFALQRAVDPDTDCPLYSTVSCIKNASKINAGKKDVSTLGVKAIDDYTLQITLSYADEDFLSTLSTAVAMPCNEEFFEATNGRYGLDLMYTMFNGQFIVTNELEASYILQRNDEYAGPSPAIAGDLTLNIVDEDESLSEDLIDGYYDAAYLRGYEITDIGDNSGITLEPYSDITWVLAFNSSSDGILSNKDARHAISLAVSDIDYEEFTYLTEATGFVPPSCTANGESYTEQHKDITEDRDEDEATELWKEAIEEEEIYTIEITLIAPETMEDVAKALLQGIQSTIGAVSIVDETAVDISIILETMTESEVKSTVASGDYDFALYPCEATSSSPISYLQTFSTSNVTGFDSTAFDSLLEDATEADSSELIKAIKKCEKSLLKTYCYSPLFFESNYYAQAKGVTGVQFHAGTGRVSFIYADRS